MKITLTEKYKKILNNQSQKGQWPFWMGKDEVEHKYIWIHISG